KFFDLHTAGIGYLNRFREVKPDNGRNYQSVTIAALRGNADNVQYTYIDCIVVAEEAKNVLLNLVDTDEKDAKYMIGFNIGDIYPETFTYKSGNKQGQTGVSLKGRLIKIKWLRKNNELIYEPQTTSAEEQSTQQAHPASDQAQPVTHQNQAGFSEVFLSQEDPAFDFKKETLEKQGYRLNSERGSWQLNAAA
ncbi:MAG: DUF3577 domain-containing protein, partial [Gammaproteobacteria bacterium]|nr:DUF3577 domain-containing protein [Gammaproteobacteria bacterium]